MSVNSPALELTARVRLKGRVTVRVSVRVTVRVRVSASITINKNNSGAGELTDKYPPVFTARRSDGSDVFSIVATFFFCFCFCFHDNT